MQTTLNTLLADNIVPDDQCQHAITGLTLDSRQVKSGDIFFACMGGQTDGRHYIDEAIGRGAAAVICEATDAQQAGYRLLHSHTTDVPIIAVANIPSHIGAIAARFYDYPSGKMPVFGITGTNGKTSCTHLLAQAYAHFNKNCGLIGTIGYGFLHQLTAQTHTTPDAICLQQWLATLQQQHADAVAMEISSHALAQGRVNGVELNTAIFTNLTRDHLDYHDTMENYAKAKRRLFDLPLKHMIINADDKTGRCWLDEFATKDNVYAYSMDNHAISGIAMIKANRVTLHQTGLTVSVQTPWGDGVLRTQLLGRFNVSNLLCVLATLCLQGYALHDVLQALAYSKTIAGRMEPFGNENTPMVIIDYAHTPDALMQALMALREHCQGHVWCVFGCGGDRDRGKRALMAHAAQTYADRIIITDDNSRHEDPEQIARDIVAGFDKNAHDVSVIHARDRAIAHAINNATHEDMILVAGKGHESYQLVWGEKRSFSDRDYVRSLVS